jgi:hypothetical protein
VFFHSVAYPIACVQVRGFGDGAATSLPAMATALIAIGGAAGYIGAIPMPVIGEATSGLALILHFIGCFLAVYSAGQSDGVGFAFATWALLLGAIAVRFWSGIHILNGLETISKGPKRRAAIEKKAQ